VKKVLVLGGAGFIGGHLVKKLVSQENWVRSVDQKVHEYGAKASEFFLGDLSDAAFVKKVFDLPKSEVFDEVYQLAADMGGAGYIFSGENDAQVMYNSATINLNVLNEIRKRNLIANKNQTKIFYSSSACIYPAEIQRDPQNPGLKEDDAYPANPDSEYGWEKLFSERVYFSFNRNYGIPVRVARFHNIFGPEGTWKGGREKSPAAICRKVAMSSNPGQVEIWGDGNQTRSYLYVDECLEAVEKLMNSGFKGPVNIGSEEMVSINRLVELVAEIAGKTIEIRHIDGPLGVRGRNSNNELVRKELKWDYSKSLREGLVKTYKWIESQVHRTT
jgi:GDP-D-mannose 3', 5'-epimerase